MLLFDDYRKEDGNVDWKAYRAAEVAAGERCYQCGGSIMFAKGYRTSCLNCQGMDSNKGKVRHDSLIRCPKCGATTQTDGRWEEGIHADGEHDVMCYECDHTFTVTTYVSYSFESPERLPDEPEDESEDE